MADEKTARGKPLPKEEVDFVLIGAGGIVVIVSWWRVEVNSFSTNLEAELQNVTDMADISV